MKRAILLFLLMITSAAPAQGPPGGGTPIDVSCSTDPHFSLANLNEVKSKGGSTNPTLEFVEFKILADNTDIAGWEICFSDNPSKEVCTEIGQGNGTWYSDTQTTGQPDNQCIAGSTTNCTTFNTNTWIVYGAKNVKADAGEVILRESVGDSGRVLDYIRYSNQTGICGDDNERWNLTDDFGGPLDDGTVDNDITQCSYCFDERDPDQKDFARTEPDGTGDWGNNGDAPTEGAENEQPVDEGGAFQITTDGSGSTCSAVASLGLREPVSITVFNQGGNVFQNYNGTVNLFTSSGHGTWFIDDGLGNNPDPPLGTLTDNTADDGAASYQFNANDNGTVTLYLANEHADDLTVTVQEPGGSPSSTSGVITFRDNVFVIDPVTCTGASCPGTASTEIVAGRPHAFEATMMRRDADSGDCGPAGGYNHSDLSAWITRDVDDPGGTAPEIGGAALPDTAPGVALTISFSNGVSAPFDLDTFDVGKYTLNLRDGSSGFVKDVNGNNRPINGTSATLTVRPFAFGFTDIESGGTANPGAEDPVPDCSDPAGPCFAAAGEIFEVRAGGYLWQSADDAGDDGLPDSGADVTDNGVTPRYAWETDLDLLLNTPSPGFTGNLGGTTVLIAADFEDGGGNKIGFTDVTDLTYSEVGSIRLTAQAEDFLNTANVNIDGESPVIGRFTPFDFTITLDTAPEFAPACSAGITPFTYLDQPFDYAIAPQVTITAISKLGNITQNYDDNWWKLDDFTENYIHAGDPLDGGVVLDGTVAGHVPFDCTAGGDCNGQFQTTFNGPLTYARASTPVEPFDASVEIDFSLIDSDGIASTQNPYTIGPITFENDDDRQRWGRLVMINAGGSELLAVNVPVLAEYYDGTGFIPNADDSCTVIEDLDSDILLTNPETSGGTPQPGDSVMTIGAGTTQITSGPTAVTSGEDDITFSAPGDGNTGFVDIEINLAVDSGSGGSDDPWLQYDWDDDGSHDNNPAGRASFGIFRGSDDLIYIREPWN